MTYDMKHNDRKRDNGRRDNVSTARRRHTTCGRLLRMLLLLMVMMVMGFGDLWGQLNGAGTYYIKNNSTEYYLVPTINCFYNGNENQPHLTTFKTGGDKNSIWRVEVESDGNNTYYRLIHNATGKYIIINDPVTDLANGNAHRKRIHLETTNSLGDNSLFEIETTDNTNYSILPGKSDWYSTDKANSNTGTFKYLNPRGGNKDKYQAEDGSAINNTTNTYGIIGFWSSTGGDSNWNFVSTTNTCANPVIEYADASTIQISYPIASDTGWTIYYTTDGSDPSNNTNARTSITSTASISATGVSKVRAIATKEGWDSSDEAVLIASGANQLIQSKDCEAFYMVPPVNDGDDTHATTTNIPTSKMGWVFEPDGLYCGIQYYKIKNSDTSEYLYCYVGGKTKDALIMKASSAITTAEDKYRAKFRLIPQADGSYKLVAKWWAAENPTGGYYLTKDNDIVEGIKTAVDAGDKSQWNVIPVPSMPKSQFDNSFASSSTDNKYYKIRNANSSYNIIPPTTVGGNATAGNNAVGNNTMWYFVPTTDGDSWVEFYHIRNGLTGEYLYFNGNPGDENTFYTSNSIITGNDDQYKFIVVKGANRSYSNAFNIIPKALKNQVDQANNSLNRINTILRTQNSRAVVPSLWNLEADENYKVAPPYITYDVATNTATISCTYPGATIYYTTDGSEATTSSTNTIVPVSPGPTASTSFVLTADIATIRAIVSKGGVGTSSESTYSVAVQLTLSDAAADQRPYLIQSQNYNTSSVTWAEPCYYMIPSDADNNSNITVNTTTLLQPSMEWYFLNAGIESDIQYYYIVNNSSKDNENHPYYLCYDSGVFMRVFDSENANKYKFSIVQYPTTGTPTGFNLKPYGQTSFIHKSNGNNSADAITLNSNNNSSGASIWKFIIKADLPASLPFSVSDNRNTYYYKLSTNANSDYFITPSTTNEYVTTYNTTSDNQNWYFEQAEAATDADWLTYYHIRNAITGEYLYYNGEVNGNNHSNAFELHSSIGNDADRYKFAMTRAIYQDRWFIVPKVLKNTQFANISTIWRDNNNALKTQKTRNNSSAMWQFTVSNFCMPPFFEESNGNITISCDTKGAEIHFLTDGNNPTEASTLYNNDHWSSSDQVRIKAIAVVMEDEAVTASSAVITLINNPDITLEAGPYEYKGAAWEPSLTVSIGESGSETTAPTSPASYTTTYANNINAGTATVTLTDVEGDSWYIWNGSKTFTIDQKAITITADSDTKEYDGTPLTNDSYTCSPEPALATGDSFESVTITGSQTDVGRSPNKPIGAVIKNGSDKNVTANYDITYVNGTLEVTVRSIGDGINPASGFTLEFGEGGALIIKDGEIALTENTDFIEATTESGKYATRTVSGKGNYNGSFTIRNAKVNFQNDGNGGTEYSATFVAESAAGSASNNSANGHALPEGITAYIITSISGNNANAEALGYIPEGIPVLLLSNAASGGFVVQDASGHTGITSDQINNNMLEEVTAETSGYVSDSESEYYQKAYFDTRIIYLLYMNEFVYNMAGYLAKGKVYLNPNHSSGGGGGGGNSRLQIRWDTETGIDDSHLSPLPPHLSGPWYTLDGRRLSGKPTQKGLYLCNGQKTVVR